MGRGDNKRLAGSCHFCGSDDTLVIRTTRRVNGEGRRRTCLACGRDFYTIQRAGQPEVFDCVAADLEIRSGEYKRRRRVYVKLRELAEGLPHVMSELEKARKRTGVLSID